MILTEVGALLHVHNRLGEASDRYGGNIYIDIYIEREREILRYIYIYRLIGTAETYDQLGMEYIDYTHTTYTHTHTRLNLSTTDTCVFP